MVRRPLQCIGRDALLSRLYMSRLYGADVAPFPASSEESTNSVCFRYKAVTAGWYRFGIGCSIGDTDTEPKPQISARYRYRVLVSV